MSTLNQETLQKELIIKNEGYNFVKIYECQLKNDSDFQKF